MGDNPIRNTVSQCDDEGSLQVEFPDCMLCGAAEARTLFVARDRLVGQPGEFPVVRCIECGFVYLRSRPCGEALDAFYPDEYYPIDETMPQDEATEVARGLLDRVSRLVQRSNTSGVRTLDIGCGNGLFLNLARDAGFDVLGVERSESAASFARQVYDLPVVTGELADAGLDAESFDIVVMWHVLEHLPEPVDALRTIERVLRPGGVLLFGVPNIESAEAWFFGRRWFSLDAPRHLGHFSPRTARRATELADLSVARIDHSSGTAGMVYSLMGDLTGVSLKLRNRELSPRSYRRWFRLLNWLTWPICSALARLRRGGAIEVYAVKPVRDG